MLSPVSTKQPRELLETPELFADLNVPISKEYSTGIHHHDAVAAQLQSVIAYTVKSVIKTQGRRQKIVAEQAGMDYKRLYRLLRGETWMKMSDIVGLSRALDMDLARAVEHRGSEETAHWRFVNVQRLPLKKDNQD